MKYKSLIITAVVCTSVGFAAFAQTIRGEGLSRQVISLKSMMESFANDIRPRINTLETDVSDLQDRENERTTCNNISGDSSIYWPNHPEADATTGCVSHEDLGTGETVTTGAGCQNRTVSWTANGRTCSGNASSIPDGLTYVFNYNTAPSPTCQNRYTTGVRGQATFRCNNGTYEHVTSEPTVCEGVSRSHPDWGGSCR
ncbi:MAG: hypothetical protein VX730_07735 [Pseudomonadota bacterium]|nr:hypothetical protein [Pseudomonadota bacterium]